MSGKRHVWGLSVLDLWEAFLVELCFFGLNSESSTFSLFVALLEHTVVPWVFLHRSHQHVKVLYMLQDQRIQFFSGSNTRIITI